MRFYCAQSRIKDGIARRPLPSSRQTPEVGGSALKSGQIDAHANFVPFGELFPFRGFARKILDGSSTGVPTTHGIQVRSDFAEKYPEIVVAYLKSAREGDRLLRENPEGLAERDENGPALKRKSSMPFMVRTASKRVTILSSRRS